MAPGAPLAAVAATRPSVNTTRISPRQLGPRSFRKEGQEKKKKKSFGDGGEQVSRDAMFGQPHARMRCQQPQFATHSSGTHR
ncbi:MAG: hypothetical protein ACPIOQ_20360, partial [Promethearchaeia archaeon]